MSTQTDETRTRPRRPRARSALGDFERAYRANVGAITAYFARRSSDPHDVADLTSETVLAAAGSFGSFDASRGSERAWLFGVAAHVWARECARRAGSDDATRRLAGLRPLDVDEFDELAARIDALRDERGLMDRWARSVTRGAADAPLPGPAPDEERGSALMTRFEDNLWASVVEEHGDQLAGSTAPATTARSRRARPKILAGSTLALAGVGAGIVLAIGGTAATAPAFAVTRQSDGTILVQLNYQADQNLPQVNAKLAAMGTGEQVSIVNATGSAAVAGPVTCTPQTGASVSGPTVKVLEGPDGTEVIKAGQSAGNTAEGTYHLTSCVTSAAGGGATTGGTGAG